MRLRGFILITVALLNWPGLFEIAEAQITLTPIGHANFAGTAYDITAAGPYAYLANYNGGLRIYNASNPTNIVNVGLPAKPISGRLWNWRWPVIMLTKLTGTTGCGFITSATRRIP